MAMNSDLKPSTRGAAMCEEAEAGGDVNNIPRIFLSSVDGRWYV